LAGVGYHHLLLFLSMSGRGEWAEKKPVAFCRARFSYTGMEKGDLTFSRDEVLLACPLSLAAFVHRTNSAPGVGRDRGGSGSGGEASTAGASGSGGRGVRWVLAIHPDGECGRIPANYVTPLVDEGAPSTLVHLLFVLSFLSCACRACALFVGAGC
jgi:hypothetical protein